MARLLDGVTVLDLTRVVAGPACTRTLSDYGAHVIKVEPPEGDLMRRGVPKANGVALGFAQQNAGKAHLCIDLSKPEGTRLVRRLAARADVVVENYRPGVADRLGIGYADVCGVNPEVIYCSITGYGQDGPAAHRRAYAPVIHAELGLLDLNARERGTEPMPEAVSHVDFAVGAQAASAILAALFGRERTGKGQHIDVTMAETMLATNEFSAVEINGGFGDEISPFRPGKAALLKLADGSWVQVPGNPTTWIFGVAKALGRTEELAARGWVSHQDTQGQDDDIRLLMQEWAGEYENAAAFEQALDSARIPLGTVKSLAEAVSEDWADHRRVLVDLEVNGAQRQIPRSPARFSNADVGPRRGAYLRGADNREELKAQLALSDAELDALEGSGVLLSEAIA
ncbi:MAG: CoA transferase [Gammaproteobacteria bacterium]|nr:CoA transferase [Gammaproteobacteria bacterium]